MAIVVCMLFQWNSFKIFYFQNKDDPLAANAFLEEAEVNKQQFIEKGNIIFLTVLYQHHKRSRELRQGKQFKISHFD